MLYKTHSAFKYQKPVHSALKTKKEDFFPPYLKFLFNGGITNTNFFLRPLVMSNWVTLDSSSLIKTQLV